MELIRDGRCEAAIPLLRRANEIGDLRNALWNLATCYALMRRPRPAIDAYRQYMEHPRTNARDRAAAQEAIERLEASLAHLEIASTVEGARVRINGLDEGVTPLTAEVGPGTCVVEVTSPGFRTWSRELELGAGQTQSLRAELELEPGELVVTSEPSGAEVLIDGEAQEGATPWHDDDLTGGGHLVELRLDGYRTAQRQVLVDPGERTSLEVALHPVEGTLVVASNATRATLSVDGEERARSPFSPLTLEPGRYQLAVEAEDHGDWNGEVDVFDQRTTSVELELPSTEGVHRAWFWSVTGLTLSSLVVSVALAIAGLYWNGRFQAIAQDINGDHNDPLGMPEARADGRVLLDRVERYAMASFIMITTTGLGSLAMFFLGIYTRFRETPASARMSIEESGTSDGAGIAGSAAVEAGAQP